MKKRNFIKHYNPEHAFNEFFNRWGLHTYDERLAMLKKVYAYTEGHDNVKVNFADAFPYNIINYYFLSHIQRWNRDYWKRQDEDMYSMLGLPRPQHQPWQRMPFAISSFILGLSKMLRYYHMSIELYDSEFRIFKTQPW